MAGVPDYLFYGDLADIEGQLAEEGALAFAPSQVYGLEAHQYHAKVAAQFPSTMEMGYLVPSEFATAIGLPVDR